ncbi:hypothetical protein BDW66DRAFT_130949 [Aspergillus desertorum]
MQLRLRCPRNLVASCIRCLCFLQDKSNVEEEAAAKDGVRPLPNMESLEDEPLVRNDEFYLSGTIREDSIDDPEVLTESRFWTGDVITAPSREVASSPRFRP